MNLNTTEIAINRCVVCDYPFADRHHIWPQAKGGKTLPTMLLCPNHHRFANLMQAMVIQRMTDEQIKAFAADYFDEAFNVGALPFLIEEQRRVRPYARRVQLESLLRANWARGDAPVPLNEYLQALELLAEVLTDVDES